MWTEQTRGRMAKIAKKTKRYPSDLTDEEWAAIEPLMPKPGRRGRPREIEFHEVINAVRYLVRSGCGWRMLPIHFGPWPTVYGAPQPGLDLADPVDRVGRHPGEGDIGGDRALDHPARQGRLGGEHRARRRMRLRHTGRIVRPRLGQMAPGR